LTCSAARRGALKTESFYFSDVRFVWIVDICLFCVELIYHFTTVTAETLRRRGEVEKKKTPHQFDADVSNLEI
jgi:hypothetical protein